MLAVKLFNKYLNNIFNETHLLIILFDYYAPVLNDIIECKFMYKKPALYKQYIIQKIDVYIETDRRSRYMNVQNKQIRFHITTPNDRDYCKKIFIKIIGQKEIIYNDIQDHIYTIFRLAFESSISDEISSVSSIITSIKTSINN